MTKDEILSLLQSKLIRHFGRDLQEANREQLYHATALVIRDLLMDKWVETQDKIRKKGSKQVYYFSMEFLLGRSLRNNVFNLGLTEEFERDMGDMKSHMFDLLDKMAAFKEGAVNNGAKFLYQSDLPDDND